jgi:hypothetical protein
LAKTLCGFCVVGGISSELVFRIGSGGWGRFEELVDISLFFVVHLGFAVSWVEQWAMLRLASAFISLFLYLSGFVTRGLHLGYGFTAGSFGGVGNVSHLFCLGSTWVSVLEASFRCALAVFFYSFGETGGLGFGKAFGKHLGAWRAKRCVVCWVCSQRRAQMVGL